MATDYLELLNMTKMSSVCIWFCLFISIILAALSPILLFFFLPAAQNTTAQEHTATGEDKLGPVRRLRVLIYTP